MKMQNEANLILLTLFVTAAAPVQAQWTMQVSNTTAGLRGIHALNADIAWASGTNGTILHTTNGGEIWSRCATPPNAEKLDFRAIQAFNQNTAIIMSAGKGDLSRIYKTTNACRTWKLLFTNPDPEGFWDAMQFRSRKLGALIGDPVDGVFPIFITTNLGDTWTRVPASHIAKPKPGQSIFAASNSSLVIDKTKPILYLVTGGGANEWIEVNLKKASPMAKTLSGLVNGPTAGAFSLGMRSEASKTIFVAVGGDYKLPQNRHGTATAKTTEEWKASNNPPSGFRSAVAYDSPRKRWIAVGTNGSDFSTDDGQSWQPLDSQNWNALSLPFAVGPEGRIGKLQ